MHRTEGPDEILESGKRRYKETPTPPTVVNKFAMNAVQEELCLVIENVGMTLNASGAADRAAGWGQVYTAIQRMAANVVGFGADPTGVADSKAAIQACLDLHKFAFLPDGLFKINTALTLPDGGAIIGMGRQSILYSAAAINLLNLGAVDFYVANLQLRDGTIAINCPFSADKIVFVDNVWIEDSTFGLVVKATSGVQGKFFGKNIYLDGMGTNFTFGHDTEGDAELILIDGLYSYDATINYIIGKSAGGGEMILTNSKIYEGILEWRDETKKMWLVNSFIDVDVIRFDNTNGGGLRDCQLGALSNTFTHDYNSSSSRIFVMNVRDEDGKLDGVNNLNGIQVVRNRSGSSQSCPGDGGGAVTHTDIDFNNETIRKMATNSAYTKDDPWDGTNHEFDVLGYGNGHVYIEVHINMSCITTTPTDETEVNLFLLLNGSRVLRLAKVLSSIGAPGTLQFTGAITLAVDNTDVIAVDVENNQTAAINVLQTDSVITIEGL